MNQEFQYDRKDWDYLKRQLPDRWIQEGEADLKENYVWVGGEQKSIATTTKQGKAFIAAKELFLETMRLPLQGAIIGKAEGIFLPSKKLEKKLNDCNLKFANLLNFTSKLPVYVRCELDTELVDALEETLKVLTDQPRGPIPRLPNNTYRKHFLKEMLHKYQNIYGELPNHTRNRDNANAQCFYNAATRMCKLAGFSDKGIEPVLAEIKDEISIQI